MRVFENHINYSSNFIKIQNDQDNDGEDNNEPVEPSSPEIEKDKSSGNYQYEEVFVKIISVIS